MTAVPLNELTRQNGVPEYPFLHLCIYPWLGEGESDVVKIRPVDVIENSNDIHGRGHSLSTRCVLLTSAQAS